MSEYYSAHFFSLDIGFLIGGFYQVGGQSENYPFILMTTGNSRRTALDTFWDSTHTTGDYDSFTDAIIFNSNITATMENYSLSLVSGA